MTTTARVVVLPQTCTELRVETVELPDPAPQQVVVKQFASGICHSQLHQIHRSRKSQKVVLVMNLPGGAVGDYRDPRCAW